MSTAILLAALVVGIDPNLLSAVCFVESGHKEEAYVAMDGKTPSYGLCQIKKGTARDMGFRGSSAQLMQAETNAFYAAKYLKYHYKRNGNWEKAVISYNAGRPIQKQTYLNKVKKVMGEKKWTKLTQSAHVGKNQQKKPSQLLSITTALAARQK